MADTKTSALSAIDAVAAVDLFMVVDDPGGTPISKKATAAQVKTFVETGRFVASASSPTVNDDSADGYVAGTQWLNTTTGQRFSARDVSVGAAVWVLMDGADHFGYISGNWYMANTGVTLASGNALAANTARYLPFQIKSRVTISTLGIRINTLAVSGNIQLAVYASNNATGRPTGAALAVTASISTTSTGLVTADITGADVTLEPGLYWMAVNADTTAGTTVILQTYATSGPLMTWLVGASAHGFVNTGGSASRLSLSMAETFGTWSNVTAGSFTETTSQADGALQFKVA